VAERACLEDGSVLVHPWDAAVDDSEWRAWLLDGNDFGELIAPGRDRDLPVVVPTHFVYDGTTRCCSTSPGPIRCGPRVRPAL